MRPKNPSRVSLATFALTFHQTASAVFCIAALLCSTALAKDVRDGIVAYWPMEEITGGTTADAAFTNTLTAFGTPTTTAGKFGNALNLPGATYLTNLHAADAFPTAGLPIYGAGAYTICMWVKGTNQTARYLYTEGNLASANTLFVLQTGNSAANNAKLDVIIRNDGNTTLMNHVVSSSVVFDNTWHHIAWVDENGQARLYVDGQLDAANFNYGRSGAFTLNSSTVGGLIRHTVSGANFIGQIDDLALWERPLSPDEINFVRTNGIATPITPVPPSLYVVPVSTNRSLGDWAMFAVRAYAHRPDNNFSYQWFKNGSIIPDATNRTYQTEHLTVANTGDYYSVAVTNNIGFTNTPNATITVSADPAADLRTGLVNYWPLNYSTEAGTNLFTADLYSRMDMVLQGDLSGAVFVEGRPGNSNALSFDFVTRYTYRTNGTPIYTSTNYTVAMWVQGDFSGQDDRRVFSEGSPTNNNPLFTIGTDPTAGGPSASIYIRTDGNSAVVGGRRSTRPVFDNTWHHIAWTDVNGQGRLYIDGVLDETDYTYTRGASTVSLTSLGAVLRAAPGNFYFGNIDEVATWNRPLTYTEIQQVINSGIPAPLAAIPPTIASQPASRTNNTWVGDDILLSVSANGTFPLTYQWYKDNQPISTASNPSATTSTLSLSNAQVSADGAYYVVLTNVAGSATSETAQVLVQPWTPLTKGEALKIDAGVATSPNVQPGWDEFTLANNGGSFNSVGVTVSPIGGINLNSRNRPTDATVWVTNAPPLFTYASVYNDFIYASSSTVDTGMRIEISRLAPNTPYGVTLWSYDVNSSGTRVSDWVETSSGTAKPVATAYTFDGALRPTGDYDYTMGGLFTSSATGKLVFEGRRNSASVNTSGSADMGVFFNAIRLVAQPTGTKVRSVGFVNDRYELLVEGDYAGQPVSLQQSSTLAAGSWTTADTAAAVKTNGPAVLFEIPTAPGSMFYRAVSQSTW